MEQKFQVPIQAKKKKPTHTHLLKKEKYIYEEKK